MFKTNYVNVANGVFEEILRGVLDSEARIRTVQNRKKLQKLGEGGDQSCYEG